MEMKPTGVQVKRGQKKKMGGSMKRIQKFKKTSFIHLPFF